MRLIASDLDGTIVGHDGKISARTVDAFAAARAAGVGIVFVTGRPPRWLDPLVDQLGHEGLVICSNGAVVYDLGQRRVLDRTTIAADDVYAARERIEQAFPDARFALESLAGFVVEPGFLDIESIELRELAPQWIADVLPRRARVTDGVEEEIPDDESVVKFLAKHPTLTPDDFLGHVRGLVSDLVAVTHSSPGVALVEMAPQGIDKAVTLARYAERHGIDAGDVYAFGDMPNDRQMLRWAGHGYAMASGHPEAREAAANLAPPFDEDGVAQVIEGVLASGHDADPPSPAAPSPEPQDPARA
ncbi:HAD family hydrolase [Tersicoccus solisilvae]|uniref:HAD family hydrolase n=1 Tax=Tersicoccus solisilvae TaxID=1882339 RepID=UPI00166DCBF1|nr:HAD family hydrolase [Tersicoccus solisilvae]